MELYALAQGGRDAISEVTISNVSKGALTMSMRFTPDVCPECGEPIYGTCDMIPGAALLTANGDGTFDYSGETEVFWDGQMTNDAGEDRVWVQCHNGHEWKAVMEED